MILDPITDDAKSAPPVLQKPNTAGACTYSTAESPNILDGWDSNILLHTPSGGGKKDKTESCAGLRITPIFHRRHDEGLYLLTHSFQATEQTLLFQTKCSDHISVLLHKQAGEGETIPDTKKNSLNKASKENPL